MFLEVALLLLGVALLLLTRQRSPRPVQAVVSATPEATVEDVTESLRKTCLGKDVAERPAECLGTVGKGSAGGDAGEVKDLVLAVHDPDPVRDARENTLDGEFPGRSTGCGATTSDTRVPASKAQARLLAAAASAAVLARRTGAGMAFGQDQVRRQPLELAAPTSVGTLKVLESRPDLRTEAVESMFAAETVASVAFSNHAHRQTPLPLPLTKPRDLEISSEIGNLSSLVPTGNVAAKRKALDKIFPSIAAKNKSSLSVKIVPQFTNSTPCSKVMVCFIIRTYCCSLRLPVSMTQVFCVVFQDSQQVLKQLVAGSRNSVFAEPPPELVSLHRSGSGDRNSILADRLGKLENASQVRVTFC